MSIHDEENATQSDPLYETYTFTLGSTTYDYTSDYTNRVTDEGTFTAITIERTGFAYSSDMSQRVCTVTVPNTDALAVALRQSSSVKAVKVVIHKYYDQDISTFESIFTGYATGISFSGGLCTIEFQSIMLELERNICRVRYQALCNNELFDSVCGLDPNGSDIHSRPFKTTTTVTVSTDGKTLTSNDFIGSPAYPDDYFALGRVIVAGDYRLITASSGNAITLQYRFDSSVLATGGSVDVYPGCNKHPGDACVAKFDNLVNQQKGFVGMPYIPLKDSNETAMTNE